MAGSAAGRVSQQLAGEQGQRGPHRSRGVRQPPVRLRRRIYLASRKGTKGFRVVHKLFGFLPATTRFFPVLFASYRASSARRIRSSAVSSKENSARPQLTVNVTTHS